jgi:hypothetical protein
MEATKLLKISEIVFDEELYPRQQYDWQTAYRYSEAMKAGALFPPINVALFAGKNYLIDGKHRIEAFKLAKEEYIEAFVKPIKSRNAIFIAAVKSNIVHGRQLSSFDRAKIILKLQGMKITNVEISKIVNISVGKITSFVARRITNSVTGEEIVLKAPVKGFNGQVISEEFAVRQEKVFASQNQEQVIEEMLVLLENKAINTKNPAILNKLKVIAKLIRELVLSKRKK